MHQPAFSTFRIRWFVLPALTMVAVLGIAGASSGKSLVGATASSAQNGALQAHVSTGKTAMRRTGRQCRTKGMRAAAARRRACRHKTTTRLPAVAGPTMVDTSSPESNDDPLPGNPAESLADFPGVTRRCDLVEGDCGIYSDRFWELQAKYQRFEIATAVYPYPPECMEAWENGEPIGCIAAIAFLYPDGTIGTSHWVIDPCSPKGWRFWEPDPPSC